MRERYRAGVLAPGHNSLIDSGKAVKQIGAIKDVGEQFLCCVTQHDGGHLGPVHCFDDELETGAGE
jgi:hypothetical protein